MKLTIQGVDKKSTPHQKWISWFIMTKIEEKVNKSYVFVLVWLAVCNICASNNCNFYSNVYKTEAFSEF